MSALRSSRLQSLACWAARVVSSIGCATPSEISTAAPAADGSSGGAADHPGPGSKDPGTAGEPGLTVVAVTDDGAVAFTRGTVDTQSLEVFDPISGTSTVLVARFAPADQVVVAGKVVAFWAAVDHDGIGELGLWTRDRGRNPFGPRSLAGVFAASLDGARVAYASNASPGRKCDLSVGSPSLEAPPATAIRGAVAGSGDCEMRLGFVQQRLFVASCSEGASAPAIRTVSDTNGVVTILASAKRDWATDAAGTKVFVISSEGAGSVHTVPQNRATLIDQDVAWAQLGDNDSVVYRTNAGALKKASTRSPVNAQTLVSEGIRGVAAVSPDLSYALVSASLPDATNHNLVRHDVQLNPISPGLPFIPTPTKPTLLVATPTGLALGFTADGERAVYLSDLPALGLPVGTLKAHALEATEEVVLAREAFMPKLLVSSSASRIVFADHPRLDGDKLVAVDVQSVDAQSGRVSLVMKGVDPAFGVTSSLLVYTVAGRGIFTTNLP